MSISDIQAKINQKLDEASELIAAAEKEDRGLTGTDLEKWEAIAGEGGEVEKLKGQLAIQQRQEKLEAESRKAVNPIRPHLPAGKDPGEEVPTQERPKYSLRAVLEGLKSNQRGAALDGLEGEIHEHLAQSFGHEARGIYVPYWALAPTTRAHVGMELRQIGKESPTTFGASLVGTDHLASAFIELLRNATMVGQAGATILPGLVGDVHIPKQTAAATAAWQNPEEQSITPSDSQYGAVQLSPKTAAAITDMTRTMQKQSTPAIEDLVRADLAGVISIAIDWAALNGTGANRTPLGIANSTGVHAVAGASWGWDKVVQMETDVASANALRGSLAYMYGAGVMNIHKTTTKTSTGDATGFLEEPGGTCNGYSRYVTEQVASGEAFFGNWSDLLIGQWGGLDMFADPYTVGDSGSLRIRAFQDVDTAVRHGESFAHATAIALAP